MVWNPVPGRLATLSWIILMLPGFRSDRHLPIVNAVGVLRPIPGPWSMPGGSAGFS